MTIGMAKVNYKYGIFGDIKGWEDEYIRGWTHTV